MHDDPTPDEIRRKADELELQGQHETAHIMRRVADDIEAQEGDADPAEDAPPEA